MSVQIPYRFTLPSKESFAPGKFINGRTDSALLGSVLYNFAHAKRNQLSTYLNQAIYYEDGGTIRQNGSVLSALSVLTTLNAPQHGGVTPLIMPMEIGHSIEPGFVTRFWLRLSMPGWASELSNATVFVQVGSKVGSAVVNAEDEDWYSIDIPSFAYAEPSAMLSIYGISSSTRVPIILHGAGAYQLSSSCASSWVDLNTAYNQLGSDDYPYSTARIGILHGMSEWVHSNRVPRSNILNHWGQNRGLDSEFIGRYKFIKRAKVSQLKCVVRTVQIDDSTTSTVSVYIKKSNGDDITNSPQTFLVSTIGITSFDTLTFDLVGDEATGEQEYEMMIVPTTYSGSVDTWRSSVSIVESVEAGLDANISMISVDDLATGTNILSSQYEFMRKLLLAIDRNTGRKVCCSDYSAARWYDVATYGECFCNEIAGTWDSVCSLLDGPWISNSAYWAGTALASEMEFNSMAFNCLVYPSPGAYLRAVLGFDCVASGSTPDTAYEGEQRIMAMITDNLTDTDLASADLYEFGRASLPVQYDTHFGLGQSFTKRATFLNIPNTAWNNLPAASPGTPFVFCMLAGTTDANQTEYIKPIYGQVYEPVVTNLQDLTLPPS